MIDSIFNEIKPNNYIGEIKEVDRDEIYNIKLSKTPLLEVINEDYGEYSNSNRNSKVYEGNIIKVQYFFNQLTNNSSMKIKILQLKMKIIMNLKMKKKLKLLQVIKLTILIKSLKKVLKINL